MFREDNTGQPGSQLREGATPTPTVATDFQYHAPLWYHGTYTCTHTCGAYVHVYVLVMSCHNFLIGKGHTCALRTTCVQYTCTYVVPWYVHVYQWYHTGTTWYSRTRRTVSVRTYVHVPWYHVVPNGETAPNGKNTQKSNNKRARATMSQLSDWKRVHTHVH